MDDLLLMIFSNHSSMSGSGRPFESTVAPSLRKPLRVSFNFHNAQLS
jgi:hypothetical protein